MRQQSPQSPLCAGTYDKNAHDALQAAVVTQQRLRNQSLKQIALAGVFAAADIYLKPHTHTPLVQKVAIPVLCAAFAVWAGKRAVQAQIGVVQARRRARAYGTQHDVTIIP